MFKQVQLSPQECETLIKALLYLMEHRKKYHKSLAMSRRFRKKHGVEFPKGSLDPLTDRQLDSLIDRLDGGIYHEASALLEREGAS